MPYSANPDSAEASALQTRVLTDRAIREAEGYLELGMTQHALSALQFRGKLIHASGRGCYLLGETLREMRRYREAIVPLQRSAELTPDEIPVWLALGWCFKRTGRLEKAIGALERAITIDPSQAIAHYNLACYWSLAHNRLLALRHLSDALDLDGNFRSMAHEEPDFDPIRHDPAFRMMTGVIV